MSALRDELLLRHRVVDSPINGKPIKKMLEGQTADILYSDPPWDDANAKRLQGMPWIEFMRQFMSVINNHVKGWVFVEMGVKHVDRAAELLSAECLRGVQVLGAHWHGHGKNWLLAGNTEAQKVLNIPPPFLQGGRAQVVEVVGMVSTPGQILLDPCCMNVYCASAALQHDLILYAASTHKTRAVKKVLEA